MFNGWHLATWRKLSPAWHHRAARPAGPTGHRAMNAVAAAGPPMVVLSSLFPSAAQPGAGLFIRERMFRVARALPLTVVAPQAWFPGQGMIRRFHPGYRVQAVPYESQAGIDVYFPRALALPAMGRRWDGVSMALAALPLVRRLKHEGRCRILDAHFAYPDGVAATLLGRWLDLPVSITLRGTEPRHLGDPALRPQVLRALDAADQIFAVSESLRQVAIAAGVDGARIAVVGNGVDTEVFQPVDRDAARARLGIAADASVLVTVGALVPRKGQHLVLKVLPALLARHPRLVYLMIGGASREGDASAALRRQVAELGLEPHVRFLGPLAPAELKHPLSAADISVLASSNEGWANVILEAMACGLPVVASDVGGNAEVVCRESLGLIYAYGKEGALEAALEAALSRTWNREPILAYARENTWDLRVDQILRAVRTMTDPAAARTRTLGAV